MNYNQKHIKNFSNIMENCSLNIELLRIGMSNNCYHTINNFKIQLLNNILNHIDSHIGDFIKEDYSSNWYNLQQRMYKLNNLNHSSSIVRLKSLQKCLQDNFKHIFHHSNSIVNLCISNNHLHLDHHNFNKNYHNFNIIL